MCGEVLLIKLLTEVQHVRGEKRLSISLEVSLIVLQHSIKPVQQFLVLAAWRTAWIVEAEVQ